ncbi:hypothetical protein BN903_63 [Halorubrum sp. AJ67]|nr:hypothetical protein BN903_63 [Halorubrum sp. AJ67]
MNPSVSGGDDRATRFSRRLQPDMRICGRNADRPRPVDTLEANEETVQKCCSLELKRPSLGGIHVTPGRCRVDRERSGPTTERLSPMREGRNEETKHRGRLPVERRRGRGWTRSSVFDVSVTTRIRSRASVRSLASVPGAVGGVSAVNRIPSIILLSGCRISFSRSVGGLSPEPPARRLLYRSPCRGDSIDREPPHPFVSGGTPNRWGRGQGRLIYRWF